MEITARTASKRRTIVWAAFGIVGLLMGVAYATGFAQTSNTATDTNAGEATQLLGTPAVANPSQYANMVSTSASPAGPLALTFDGNYGTVASPTVLFVIDLTKNDPYGNALAGTYYSDVILTNWAALGLGNGTGGWDTMDLQFLELPCATFTTTNSNTWTGATTQQLTVDRVDAHVTFTGLAAGTKYCIGLDTASATTESAVLAAASGGTVSGTVMFRSNAAPTETAPPAPQFAATVNRSA